jgi:hypothetical protein
MPVSDFSNEMVCRHWSGKLHGKRGCPRIGPFKKPFYRIAILLETRWCGGSCHNLRTRRHCLQHNEGRWRRRLDH